MFKQHDVTLFHGTRRQTDTAGRAHPQTRTHVRSGRLELQYSTHRAPTLDFLAAVIYQTPKTHREQDRHAPNTQPLGNSVGKALLWLVSAGVTWTQHIPLRISVKVTGEFKSTFEEEEVSEKRHIWSESVFFLDGAVFFTHIKYILHNLYSHMSSDLFNPFCNWHFQPLIEEKNLNELYDITA